MPPTSSEKNAVLTSWKDIANYMGKGVRTVQRWEQDFGLPVRRPNGSSKKAILARPRDLDAWVALRCSSRTENCARATVAPPPLQLLTSLSMGLQTSTQLRASNLELVREVKLAMERLHNQLCALSRPL